MSQSEEPSYYEIALTNRQVLIAFSILLVCMLAAFFAGLWIGRGEVDSSSPPAARLAQEDVAPADDLQEFKFFSEGAAEGEDIGDGGSQQPESRAAVESEPESARRAAEPPPAVPPPRVAPPPPPPAPAPSRTVPEDSAGANAGLPRTTVRRPPADGEALFIQVFSSRDEEQAGKVLGRLKGGGFAAFLSPVEVDGQTMYRVRVGPFTDRSAAEEVADRVRQSMRLDTWITP